MVTVGALFSTITPFKPVPSAPIFFSSDTLPALSVTVTVTVPLKSDAMSTCTVRVLPLVMIFAVPVFGVPVSGVRV